MRRFLFLAALALVMPRVVDGQVTITDVRINHNGVSTDIGDITVTIPIPGPGGAGMEATFTVANNLQYLCDWTEFHWVQVIKNDSCPARVAGVVPAFPVVDTPANGWDYMYNDPDMPPDGIQADDRVPANAKPGYADDAVDTLPWYHTVPEEAAQFTICQDYPINDTKDTCGPPTPWEIRFRTWLVAKTGANTICLIRGFEWARKNTGMEAATDLGVPTAAHATEVSNGLTNGQITGWTVNPKCNVTCAGSVVPIPTLVLVVIAAGIATAGWVTLRRVR